MSHLSALELKVSQKLGADKNIFYKQAITGSLSGEDFENAFNTQSGIEGFRENHRINITIHWFESNDTAVAQAYRDHSDKLLLTD